MTRAQTTEQSPLSKTELEKINAYWRAANYLSVGQIYLMDNPLLREAAAARGHQAAAAGPLGDHAGTQPDLRARQPADPQV